eukprot:gene4844-5914_t
MTCEVCLDFTEYDLSIACHAGFASTLSHYVSIVVWTLRASVGYLGTELYCDQLGTVSKKGTRAAYDDLASRNTALCPPPYKSPFDMIDDLPTTDMHQQHAQAMAQMQASRQRAEANLLSTPAPSPPILRALDACFATAVGDAKAILNFDVAAAVQQMQVLSFASKEDSLMEKKTLPELHSSNSWWDKSGCTWEETVESYGWCDKSDCTWQETVESYGWRDKSDCTWEETAESYGWWDKSDCTWEETAESYGW